jgi:hypothetical protein
MLMTYLPSLGLPIASDLAMVLGLTGCTEVPLLKAVATGEQFSAWAPVSLG